MYQGANFNTVKFPAEANTVVVGITCNMKIRRHSCMLNSIKLFARDELPCNRGNYHLVIMHWPHNHVYFIKVILIKMHPHRVSKGLISCTSPITAIIF